MFYDFSVDFRLLQDTFDLSMESSKSYFMQPQKMWLYCEGDYKQACRMIDESDWNIILATQQSSLKLVGSVSCHYVAMYSTSKRPNLYTLADKTTYSKA